MSSLDLDRINIQRVKPFSRKAAEAAFLLVMLIVFGGQHLASLTRRAGHRSRRQPHRGQGCRAGSSLSAMGLDNAHTLAPGWGPWTWHIMRAQSCEGIKSVWIVRRNRLIRAGVTHGAISARRSQRQYRWSATGPHSICCCKSRARRVALAGPSSSLSGDETGTSNVFCAALRVATSSAPPAEPVCRGLRRPNAACLAASQVGAGPCCTWDLRGLRPSGPALAPTLAAGRTPFASGASVALRGRLPDC